MKSKCLIKIQWVLEIVSKTKMSSRLTNSAHITETTGCHSGIQLPLTSPRFFRRVSGQVVSTMCSRMSLHPGFSSDAPGQASATAVLWGHCFSELPALNPGLSPGLWVNPGNDQTSQSLTGKRLLVLTISTSGLKINPLGQVSMDGGVELVVVTKQMLCHFSPRSLCSHFHWFLYSEFLLSVLGRDLLLSQSLHQNQIMYVATWRAGSHLSPRFQHSQHNPTKASGLLHVLH